MPHVPCQMPKSLVELQSQMEPDCSASVTLESVPPHGQTRSRESSSTLLWECASPSVSESCPTNILWEVESHLLLLSAQLLLEKEHEQIALSEMPCQTRGELFPAREQLQQLRQQVEEAQENGQVSLPSQVTE